MRILIFIFIITSLGQSCFRIDTKGQIWRPVTFDTVNNDTSLGFRFAHPTLAPARVKYQGVIDSLDAWRILSDDTNDVIQHSIDGQKTWVPVNPFPGEKLGFIYGGNWFVPTRKIVLDCRSKLICFDGQKWTEIKVKTHLIGPRLKKIGNFSTAGDYYYKWIDSTQLLRIDQKFLISTIECPTKGLGENASFAAEGDTLIVFNRGDLFKSFDGGRHWDHRTIPDSVLNAMSYNPIKIGLKDGHMFFFGQTMAFVMRSSDFGITWDAVEFLFEPSETTDFEYFDGYANTLWLTHFRNHTTEVSFSTDSGISWHDLSMAAFTHQRLGATAFCSNKKSYLTTEGFDSRNEVFSLEEIKINEYKYVTEYQTFDTYDSIFIDLKLNNFSSNGGQTRIVVAGADTFNFPKHLTLLADKMFKDTPVTSFRFSFLPAKLGINQLSPYNLRILLYDNSLETVYMIGPLYYSPSNIFNKYPLLSICVLIGLSYLTLLTGLLIFKPLWLYKLSTRSYYLSHLEESLGKYGIILKTLRELTCLPFFVRHPRTLDAWISHYGHMLIAAFERHPTVKNRTTYIPLPLRQEDVTHDLIEQLNPEILSPFFSGKRVALQVIGPGGSGKTTLAIQIAQWVSKKHNKKHFQNHVWLPILIEEDTKDMVILLTQKINAWTHQELQKPFLLAMLNKKRLLLLIDALSERTKDAQTYITSIHGILPANAMLITSRNSIALNTGDTKTLEPIPLKPDKLLFFIASILGNYEIAAFKSSGNQLLLANRIAAIFTLDGEELPVVPILIKLLMEKLIDSVTQNQTEQTAEQLIENLPGSIPEVFFDYLNRVNPGQSAPNGMNERELRQSAELVARESLADNFLPQDILEQKVVEILKAKGLHTATCDPVTRLKDNGILEERYYAGERFLRFTLDPLAEYLTAINYAKELGNDCVKWREFYIKIEALGDGATGFYRALRIVHGSFAQQYGWCPQKSVFNKI